MAAEATPLMRQYHAIKQQVPNALLMFRLGDFYEMFYEDAVVAARELEITLTSRNKDKADAVPMCGVPFHAAEGYIARLIQKGHRVAVCDQTEDPRFAKKLVKREITRIVTPGTATDSSVLRSHENNYLGAIVSDGTRAGLAYADVSTGEFRVTEADVDSVLATVDTLNIREILTTAKSQVRPSVRTELDDWVFSLDFAERTLRDHFRLLSLDGFGFERRPLAVRAAGAVVHYLRDTQRSALDHLDRPAYYERGDSMILDPVTVRNLELVGPDRESALIEALDQTSTGMGGRLLRKRLLAPSLDLPEIETRLDQVEWLLKQTILRASLRRALEGILDLERLLAKVTMGSATPRELLGLGRSLAVMPELNRLLGDKRFDELAEVRDAILGAISDEPPASLADGGTIRAGYNADLDELRAIKTNSQQFIAAIETRERGRTGIQSLKVRFNNVFGYYIEISKANLHLAPADYDRKQTLVNAERFTTPELKVLESKVLEAEERILTIEREIFTAVRAAAASEARRIRVLAAGIGELDVTATLAQVAAEHNYVRPGFLASGELRVLAGRHPVIERIVERDAQRFIPNDLYLDSAKFAAIITGPNMGGKSTYLRQAALIQILAQTGSFVPAAQASLPVVDRVFTRIGASDNLARGRSTFMVEMTETALILNTATAQSLVILDEIGRGTSTFDGLALAWAVIEHIHHRIGAKTLFATHYHELTELEGKLAGVANLHVSVKESGDQIIFLRKVEPGAADKSYGIEVARLAALPLSVIERAREILALHEKSEHAVSQELAPRRTVKAPPVQIQMFEPVGHHIADRIRGLDLNNLRPVEALQILSELQDELKR
ncbi:MAG: DNA mismatch repair protein MutS [Acidobacteria bacterium]|nr:DNA mismatch repair protein MutS [Acidobacteriota bacterium]